MEAILSSDEEGAAGQAAQAGEAARADGEGVGYGRPPAGRRFRAGRSGNPRGRPKRARHLGAVVGAALRERVAVTETDGRVRRLSKLEATVKQIVDGAVAGDARSIKLLFTLIKADERALMEPEAGRRDGIVSEADALVIAELRRRFAAGAGAGAEGRSGAKAPRSLLQSAGGGPLPLPSPPAPLPQAGEG